MVTGARTLAILAAAGLALGCSKTSDKKTEVPTKPEPSERQDTAVANTGPAAKHRPTPKSWPPAKKPTPKPGPPPRKPGCPASMVSLAIKWHEDEDARRNPNHKPGRTGLNDSSFELAGSQSDLDGDGKADLVLHRGHGLRAARHYFYVEKRGCPVLVGVISLSPLLGFSCGPKRHRGLCELHTSRLMIHGERQRSTYIFDGKQYVLAGRPTLGPRPPKFRPKSKP